MYSTLLCFCQNHHEETCIALRFAFTRITTENRVTIAPTKDIL